MKAEDKVNILLVDDQPARLMSYDAILGVLGQNLVQARSGTEALQQLMDIDVAAILLDVNMPGMDGFETAAMIHQHPRFEKIPIIFVTAVHVTDLDQLKGYQLGAVDYVYVPVVPEILRGKVEVLVQLYRQRRELERLNRQLGEANYDLARANAALQAEKARELEALNVTLAQANSELAQANRTLQAEVSERVRAQEALEAADRRKDDFLAMLSHELRNPLAAIQGAIELMQLKKLDDTQLVWARDVLSRQNRHLSRLIDDLLDVSRITRGKLTLHTEPVELREVMEHALETVRPLMESRRHQLTVSISNVPLHVRGDAVRLSQVMCNLLTNAAKYTDEGGKVELTLASEAGSGSGNDQAIIRVQDNGRGIPNEVLSRLFEPSTHEERLNSGEHGGLGIGLIVVRGLVQMHGGSVEARSEGAGRGSMFTVRLPLLSAEEFKMTVAPTRDAMVAEPAVASSLRILVVDDNQDSACSMTLLLELQGHEVQVAHAGQVALRMAQESTPDVILLDIGMPGMNGYEVARHLRSQAAFADTLLVAVTGYGRASDVKQTESAGFDHHLVKPIDYDKLQSLLAARSQKYSDKTSRARVDGPMESFAGNTPL
ncbi:MAG TPA: response regulator [Burkholderiales bacterium]|nr:response regulator [Burkholderiales bacterium]